MIIISTGFFMSGALERCGITGNTLDNSTGIARTKASFYALMRKGYFECSPHLSQGEAA